MNGRLALALLDARKPKKAPTMIGDTEIKKVSDRTMSYTERHRGQWFRPEYNLAEIQIAQDTDSYFFRAIEKKVNRFLIAGWDFVGKDPEVVKYVEQRIAEIEMSTDRPWSQQLRDTAHDLLRFSNCMWVKARSDQTGSGNLRVDKNGVELKPVAGYFILAFETLEFKTKKNGELVKVQQVSATGETKEFMPADLIHFFTNRKPGFSIGTPAIVPALDDIALLRRIEENVEELIETSLFPIYHYKIGTDEFPETVGADGRPESDRIKKTVEYMPAGAMYVSDHRHSIEVLGSESKALRIDFYLQYFKSRVFSALGISGVDMGEADANKGSASTLSKSLLQDVEAMQQVMKEFIDFHVINELLLEGGYNPLDEDEKVEVKFGIVDREEATKLENQTIQAMTNNLITVSEARHRIGHRPYEEKDWDDTYQKRFAEPLAMLSGMGPGTAASSALAETPTSNITPEGVQKEETMAKQMAAQAAAAKRQGAPTTKTKQTSSSRTVASRANPRNQHGRRSSAKFTADTDALVEAWGVWGLNSGATSFKSIEDQFMADVELLNVVVAERIKETGASPSTVLDNLQPRYDRLFTHYLGKTLLGATEAVKES